jgi:very-short-patch-repair endonuclease
MLVLVEGRGIVKDGLVRVLISMSRDKRAEIERIATQRARELRRDSTPAEKILWQALWANRLDNLSFYRQRPIYHDVTGRESFFVPDFYCHTASLVIELDGGAHEGKEEEDSIRTEILNALGLQVIRFTNEEVLADLDSVLLKVSDACKQGPDSPSPEPE